MTNHYESFYDYDPPPKTKIQLYKELVHMLSSNTDQISYKLYCNLLRKFKEIEEAKEIV